MTRHVLTLAAAATAAFGAGAVASFAQTDSPTRPAPPALAEECARALPSPTAGTPATYVEFDGIQGESKAPGHIGESEVDQFRFGAGTPGGPRPLVLGKAYDKASPQLLSRLVSGGVIPKVTLSQRKSAGVFLKYTLTNVTAIDVEHTGRAGANADRVCLAFEGGDVEYRTVNPDGTLSAPVKTQF